MAAVVTRATSGVSRRRGAAFGAGLLGRDAAGLEDLHLAIGELAPRALGHVLELQTGKVAAVQTDHRVVDLAQHALDLVLAPLADDDLHGGGAGLHSLRGHGLGLARGDDAADCRLAQAVVELDAATQWHKVAVGQFAVNECLVGLVDVFARVQQVLRQVAVGGKEQESRGVAVQAAHWEQARKAVAGNQVRHTGTLLRVAHGSEVAGRLVKHQVHGALVELDWHAIDLDMIAVHIDLGTQLGCDLAVDGHAAGCHQVFRSAAARHARARQKALQAHGVRVDGLGVACGRCAVRGACDARLPCFVSPRHAYPPRCRRWAEAHRNRCPQHRYRSVRALRPDLRPAPRAWTECCGRSDARG